MKDIPEHIFDELRSEWGSAVPVKFTECTLHDSKGKEIETPKCEGCGNYKSAVIGKQCYQWMCLYGCIAD